MTTATNKYLTRQMRQLKPYVAGIQPQEPGWIKLNTNENPYPPSPKILEALKNVDLSILRLYPPGDGGKMRMAIAESHGVGVENIFCGNGSDEVLALAFQAYFTGKNPIYTPDISYGFYRVWSDMYDVVLSPVKLREDYSVCPSDYSGGRGVIIANPNAPTGLALKLEDIEAIVRQNTNGVVIVDEAYIDFANVESAVKLLPIYENLMIVRTFSKSHALAGMRAGYAVANPHIIDGLMLAKESFNSYPLDILAQTAAAIAINDIEYLVDTVEKVKFTRHKTTEAMEALGHRVLPSQGNFIFMEVNPGESSQKSAKMLYEYLLSQKILARYWDKPGIDGFLRVSIGTDEEMGKFISCVQQW